MEDRSDDLGQYGALLDAQEFGRSPQALPPAALQAATPGALPPSKQLSNLPAIAMQGTPQHLGAPGSCEAQSFGYGLGSYTAARTPGGAIKWDPSQPAYQVSAAYLYRWLHAQEGRVCPMGSGALEYLNRLIGRGSPSAADIPYQPDCDYLNGIDLDPSFPDMGQFLLGSFAVFSLSEAAGPLIKQFLLNDQAVAFSGLALDGYAHPTLADGVLYGTNVIPNSGHGQLLVGYDDTRGTAEQPGAFLIQNSFGSQWPAPDGGGQIWMSYETFFAAQKLAAVAYPRDADAPSGALLTPNSASAPAAAVTRALQWAPGGSDVFLILLCAFAAPVQIALAALTEPGGSGQTANGAYGKYFSTGYVYFKRGDAQQFLSGAYALTLQATTLDGAAVTYQGDIAVPAAQPTSPPAAAMAAPIWDTTGAQATLSGS